MAGIRRLWLEMAENLFAMSQPERVKSQPIQPARGDLVHPPLARSSHISNRANRRLSARILRGSPELGDELEVAGNCPPVHLGAMGSKNERKRRTIRQLRRIDDGGDSRVGSDRASREPG